MGAEFELGGWDLDILEPLDFAALSEVLAHLESQGWAPVTEDGLTIGLRSEMGTLTMEPGGQLELSTPPRADAVELAQDAEAFRELLLDVGGDRNIGWIAAGLNPLKTAEQIQVIPKKRYGIMTDYLAQRGRLALDMMRRTQSVHVTYDYVDEADVAQMAQVANLASPLVSAMFSFSAYGEGKALGVRSYRTLIWRETDPDRCGLDRDAIEGRWSYERYIERLMKLPLIFVMAEGEYLAAHGTLAGTYFREGFQGVEPRVGDLEWVINQTFPDVRIRHYLETRGADMPPLALAPSIAAVWVGLLYDDKARCEVIKKLGVLDFEEVVALQLALATDGLSAVDARGRTGAELAEGLLKCANWALIRRGKGEETLLEPVISMVSAGTTPADELVAKLGAAPAPRALLAAMQLR